MHMDNQKYVMLADVLQRAYDQAASGKGASRHARDEEPFHEQVIMDGAKRFGTGALLFQAYKKSDESQRLPTERAVAELLGAIVYLAAAVIETERQARARPTDSEPRYAEGGDDPRGGDPFMQSR